MCRCDNCGVYHKRKDLVTDECRVCGVILDEEELDGRLKDIREERRSKNIQEGRSEDDDGTGKETMCDPSEFAPLRGRKTSKWAEALKKLLEALANGTLQT